jgi:hypothetical protein
MIRNASALVALMMMMISLCLSAVACASPTTSEGAEAEEVVTRGVVFQTVQDPDGSFRFELRAANGELLLTSDAFAAAADVEAGIERVLTHGNDHRNVAIEATAGGFVFHVRTPAGERIGTSDPYASRASAERGATTFRALIRIEQQHRIEAAPPA